jgi:streptogramin lyase
LLTPVLPGGPSTNVAAQVAITEFGGLSQGLAGGSSLPAGITAGPDGNLWFTEETGSRVGRITPAGTVTEFSQGITPNSAPLGITAGPDGNLWFTEANGNRVGRITPSGTITEFSAGITGSELLGITAGPDGNLWFTEEGGDRIGRITPAGTVTEFSQGITPGSAPEDITAGPDGNLWFTEANGLRVGRITPAGTVTEFNTDVACFGGGTVSIAAGPDGNLWFTQSDATDGDAIGRITPGGTVTEFSQGLSSGSGVQGLTAGPDGNLWFTEENGNRIGQITPTGTITEFGTGITSGSLPFNITAGPDGNLWFTEASGNRIGRAVSPPSLAALSATQWTVSQPGYSGTIHISGGTGGYSNLNVTGLPPGLSAVLNGTTVTIAGTPTASGSFTVMVSLRDSTGASGSNSYTLHINPALTLSPATLPPGMRGFNYQPAGNGNSITAAGGTGPVSLVVSNVVIVPNVPNQDGLNIPSNGNGTLTVTGVPNAAGTVTFTVTATDSTGATAVQNYSLVINPLTGNAAFVENLYQKFLHRTGDLSNPKDAGGWLNALNAGLLAPAGVANGIIRSTEALTPVVDGLYVQLLGRSPLGGEEQSVVSLLQHGFTEEQVIDVMVSGPEFAGHANTMVGGANPDSNFIQELYQVLLNRAPTPSELNAWLGALPLLGRAGLAAELLASPEYRTDVITPLFSRLLDRTTPPAPGEVSGWVHTGLDLLGIEAAFAESPEFIKNG